MMNLLEVAVRADKINNILHARLLREGDVVNRAYSPVNPYESL